MPQSRLIDVNTAAIKYRNAIDEGLASQNYSKVFGACYSLNALLPNAPENDGRQKYRITISDLMYARFTHYDVMITCTECKEQTKFSEIHVFELSIPMIVQIISRPKSEKSWVCPSCHSLCVLSESDMTEKTLKEPYFLRVVPKIPKRSDGILDRTNYHQQVVQWVIRFRTEWEASMAQFRDDNWQKKGSEYNDDVEEAGESTD